MAPLAQWSAGTPSLSSQESLQRLDVGFEQRLEAKRAARILLSHGFVRAGHVGVHRLLPRRDVAAEA